MSGWFAYDLPGERNPVTVLGYDGRPLVLEEVDLVVGGRRHLDAVTLPSHARVVVLGPVDEALQHVRLSYDAGERVVVLASGDPGFFGIVRRLRAAGLPVTVRPALSSVTMAFARLGVPWEDALVVSAHGRELRPSLNAWRRAVAAHRPVALLTEASTGPAALVEQLGDAFTGCHVFERLGMPDEAHVEVLPTEPADAQRHEVIGPEAARRRQWNEPLVVVHPGTPSPAASWVAGTAPVEAWALPDSAFVHRDGMLTKREVRAVVLPRLAPATGTLVWDVGAGSGSVGIECSRLGSAVVCVEKEDTTAITENADRHGAPVTVVRGQAPEVLAGLPHPDAVFVGGGGPDVVAAVAAVRPKRVVVTLATLERVAPTVAALEAYETDTVLVQVSHLSPLGEGSRLVPANPVFVVAGELR